MNERDMPRNLQEVLERRRSNWLRAPAIDPASSSGDEKRQGQTTEREGEKKGYGWALVNEKSICKEVSN
ncbi:hypothetical protein AAC387_Pa07g1785 [Persea americana]